MQLNPDTWILLRNPSTNPKQSRKQIFEPPKFKRPLIVKLEDGILICTGCKYKQRNGCPCDHLFCLEPHYELEDFAVRWQLAYGYYAYTPNYITLTEKFRCREATDHNGIRLKSWEPNKDNFPYLWKGSHYTPDEIMEVYNCPVPLCWNYNLEEYPSSFRQKITASNEMSFTVDEDESNSFLYSQESIDLPTEGRIEETFFENPMKHEGTKSHSQLLGLFKEILPMLDTQSSRNDLYDTLLDIKKQNMKRHMNKNVLKRQNKNNEEFHSSNIPFDTSRESVQHTYKRNRIN